MNPHDQANLRFLMSADTESLKSWYKTATTEDLVYANALLDRYSEIIKDEITQIAIDQVIEAMPVLLEAQAVIAAVRSKEQQ